jgi:hypothetical protein
METLKKVITTLGNIEVHGKGNLDMLLGCIMALEQIEQDFDKESKKTAQNGVTNNE